MSASSTPFPQFVIATVAGAPASGVAFTSLSSTLGAGTYRVDGVINASSAGAVLLSYSVSAPLVSASPLVSFDIGTAENITSVDIPISFTYVSTGLAPLVITLTCVTTGAVASASATRNLRFNKIQ
jgi:hypothetical protein